MSCGDDGFIGADEGGKGVVVLKVVMMVVLKLMIMTIVLKVMMMVLKVMIMTIVLKVVMMEV